MGGTASNGLQALPPKSEDTDDEKDNADESDDDGDESGDDHDVRQGVSAAELARRSRSSLYPGGAVSPESAARPSRPGRSGKRSGRGRSAASSSSFGWRELIIVAVLAVLLGATLTAVVMQFASKPTVTPTAELPRPEAAAVPANSEKGAVRAPGIVSRIQLSDEIKSIMLLLRQQNPNFEELFYPQIKDGKVVGLMVSGHGLENLSALTNFRELKQLSILPIRRGSSIKTNFQKSPPSLNKPLHEFPELNAVKSLPLKDLSPLRGLKLTHLHITNSNVSDLSAVSDMPLEELAIGGTAVTDLSPLAKCQTLKSLQCNNTQVFDLKPLAGLTKLNRLYLEKTLVTDLSPLRDLKLTVLNLNQTQVTDLSPLRGMPLEVLLLEGVAVTDLSCIRGMSLTVLMVEIRNEADRDVLRSLPKLEALNRQRPKDLLAAPIPADPRKTDENKTEPSSKEPKKPSP